MLSPTVINTAEILLMSSRPFRGVSPLVSFYVLAVQKIFRSAVVEIYGGVIEPESIVKWTPRRSSSVIYYPKSVLRSFVCATGVCLTFVRCKTYTIHERHELLLRCGEGRCSCLKISSFDFS